MQIDSRINRQQDKYIHRYQHKQTYKELDRYTKIAKYIDFTNEKKKDK